MLAIVSGAVLSRGSKTLKSGFAVALATAAFVALFAFGVPFPVVVFGAALIGWIRSRGPAAQECTVACTSDDDMPEHTRPSTARAFRVLATWIPLWLGPVLFTGLILGWDNVYARLAVFFSKMAVVTFGGAYAVLSYVTQQAVEHYAWLTPADMISGLALAETTPGPLILVLEYVGFMAAYASPGGLHPVLAGAIGAALTVWVTFAPCFLWIFLGAPYMEAVRANRSLSAALSGVTAAVVGVIVNLFLWFGLHTIFGQVGTWHGPLGLRLPVPAVSSLDFWALILAAGATLAMTRFKLGMGTTLAGCAGLGWVVRMVF